LDPARIPPIPPAAGEWPPHRNIAILRGFTSALFSAIASFISCKIGETPLPASIIINIAPNLITRSNPRTEPRPVRPDELLARLNARD
jgi:hypothetical protein